MSLWIKNGNINELVIRPRTIEEEKILESGNKEIFLVSTANFTAEQWDELGYNQKDSQMVRDPHTSYETKWVKGDDLVYREEIVSVTVDEVAKLGALKLVKQGEITQSAESVLRGLATEYPDMEMATWDQQYAEAQAYIADNLAETPLLAAIASQRDTTVAILADKIISNRATWVAVSGAIIGKRLKYQDALDVADTVEAVETIEVSYDLSA
jgi:hypothetical protein